jgi:CelD/BcsL family acetyltransferase involved in cellulose biosynthesis
MVMEHCGKAGLLDISTLSLGGQPIAFNIGFLYGKVVYHWKVGFDPDYAGYAPGKLLIKYLIQDCIHNGVKVLDFMRGEEEYKKSWKPEARTNYNVFVHNKRIHTTVKRSIINIVNKIRNK